ncbi:MAG: helix-turn-helix domain-containing protein, partial [Bacillota bacterium]
MASAGPRIGHRYHQTSEHLMKLLEAGLLVVERSGRHRYYRLAGEPVARALEALAVIAPPRPIRSLRESEARKALCLARICYDHLAGRVGVALAEALVRRGILVPAEHGYDVTGAGARWLLAFGTDVEVLRRQRRKFAAPCLDWSERRHHLAGALGAALLQRFLALGWMQRLEGSRAVR